MDVMKVDFGDGVSALDRTLRAITLMTSQAIARLNDAGYIRDEDFSIGVHDEGLPVWIELHTKRVFEIVPEITEGQVIIKGNWLTDLKPKKKPGFWSRLFGISRV